MRIIRFAIIVSFFLLVAAAAEQSVSAQSCDTPDDKAIVTEIYAKLSNDKVLAKQIPHINVTSYLGAVKIIGWADNQNDYAKVQSIAAEVDCVRLVNVNKFWEVPPPADSPLRSANGCASGTKPCGDICIPSGDTCSIKN